MPVHADFFARTTQHNGVPLNPIARNFAYAVNIDNGTTMGLPDDFRIQSFSQLFKRCPNENVFGFGHHAYTFENSWPISLPPEGNYVF